jgi:hypothetical protein
MGTASDIGRAAIARVGSTSAEYRSWKLAQWRLYQQMLQTCAYVLVIVALERELPE